MRNGLAEQRNQVRKTILGLMAAALLYAVPAAAQTAIAAVPANDGRWFIGGFAGASAVQNAGGTAGGEFGLRLTHAIDVFGEGAWMQDAVTRRRLELAQSVASVLQASQGRAASGTIEAPAGYGGAAIRIALTHGGRIRPYVTAGAGMARITLKPSFILAGADVTANLPAYGVTLGRDLTGNLSKPAFTGGIGVRIPRGAWYIDGGFHVLSIQTDEQVTRVLRAGGGIGFNF